MKEDNGRQTYSLYASDDTPDRPKGVVMLGGTEEGATGPSTLPMNAWTHLAVTYNCPTDGSSSPAVGHSVRGRETSAPSRSSPRHTCTRVLAR